MFCPPHFFHRGHTCMWMYCFCLASGDHIIDSQGLCPVFRNVSCSKEHDLCRWKHHILCFHSLLLYSLFHWKEFVQTCMPCIRETIARYLQGRRSCTTGVGCVTALSCVGSTGAGTHQRTYSFPLSEPGPHTSWESRRGSTSRTGKRTAGSNNMCSRYHAPSLLVSRHVY